MPLAVDIPAPAITTMFFALLSAINWAMSSSDLHPWPALESRRLRIEDVTLLHLQQIQCGI